MKDADAGDNPFGGVLYGAWQPRGVLAGLEPALAAEVAADALWSVDSIVWRRKIMGDSMHMISWEEWLQLLADAVGVNGEQLGVKPTTIKKGRLLKAFPGLIERLNSGERLRDLVREAELKWEPQAILQERMEQWRERSADARERNESFRTLRSHLEPVLDAVLAQAGSIPAFTADDEAKNAWVGAIKTVLEEQPPPVQVVPTVRRLLARRMTRRGYGKHHIGMVLDYVLPMGDEVEAGVAGVDEGISDDEVLELLI